VLHKCYTNELLWGIQKKNLDEDRGIAPTLTPIRGLLCYHIGLNPL